jgi:hypothetical protein
MVDWEHDLALVVFFDVQCAGVELPSQDLVGFHALKGVGYIGNCVLYPALHAFIDDSATGQRAPAGVVCRVTKSPKTCIKVVSCSQISNPFLIHYAILGCKILGGDKMPFVNNPLWAGNIIFKCEHCGELFTFVDDGERHERICNSPFKMVYVAVHYFRDKWNLIKLRVNLTRYSRNRLLKFVWRIFEKTQRFFGVAK